MTCVDPPPKSKAATVVLLFILPSKKLIVNQEKIPSSAPCIISTESSFTENPELANSSRIVFRMFSACSDPRRRSPAVAFNTNGVLAHKCFGINVRASSNSLSICLAP